MENLEKIMQDMVLTVINEVVRNNIVTAEFRRTGKVTPEIREEFNRRIFAFSSILSPVYDQAHKFIADEHPHLLYILEWMRSMYEKEITKG